MEFNSRVRPQIQINDDNTIEPIQSAFEKYNRHSHSFCNTGNPYDMGLRVGHEITYEGNETNIPSGTTIISMSENSVQLSTTSTETLENERFIIEGKFILDNCSINDDTDILQLEPQHGFINAEHLKLASTENHNGHLDLSNFDGLNSPVDYILYFNSDESKYITKIKVITDSADEINFSLVLEEERLVLDQVASREQYFEFLQQNSSTNTEIIENSIVYLRVHNVPPSVNQIFFHIKMNKVFL